MTKRLAAREGTPREGSGIERERRIGERVRVLRDERKWSMEDLARRIQPATSASQINKLEKAIVRLTMEWIYKIADALEVHPLDIVAPLEPRTKALIIKFQSLQERSQNTLEHVADVLLRADGPRDGTHG